MPSILDVAVLLIYIFFTAKDNKTQSYITYQVVTHTLTAKDKTHSNVTYQGVIPTHVLIAKDNTKSDTNET